jgi:hypothetical protein
MVDFDMDSAFAKLEVPDGYSARQAGHGRALPSGRLIALTS